MTHLFIYLFIYLLIYLNLFTVQCQYNEEQGNGKRTVLYGLVKLMFDIPGAALEAVIIILAFWNFFVPIPCTTFWLVQLQIFRALSLSILFSILKLQ